MRQPPRRSRRLKTTLQIDACIPLNGSFGYPKRRFWHGTPPRTKAGMITRCPPMLSPRIVSSLRAETLYRSRHHSSRPLPSVNPTRNRNPSGLSKRRERSLPAAQIARSDGLRIDSAAFCRTASPGIDLDRRRHDEADASTCRSSCAGMSLARPDARDPRGPGASVHGTPNRAWSRGDAAGRHGLRMSRYGTHPTDCMSSLAPLLRFG